MNILVIDDEGRIRNMVHAQLMEMHLNVERIDTADSAREARNKMKEHYYDIFLCDIVMPEEDGIEFAKWVLSEYPEVKFIFLTAYADIRYMKEAISMQSFDYVLQPVSSEELRSVVERAVSKVRIEKKNKELLNQGEFYLKREDTILDFRTYRFLKGEEADNAYVRRMIQKNNIYAAGESLYLPVLVKIQELGEKEPIEKELIRMIYQNILNELFENLDIRNMIVLGEEKKDFLFLLYWRKEQKIERSDIFDVLEKFHDLLVDMIHLQTSVYCGNWCEPAQLSAISKALFKAHQDNVCKECGVFDITKDKTKSGQHSLEIQVKTWGKLLAEKQYHAFAESILYYIEKSAGRSKVGTETMMQIHQMVTELVLGFLVGHQISSDQIFNEELSYIAYMNSWQDLELFRTALKHLTKRLQECYGGDSQIDPVEEIKEFIRKKLDEDITVTEIANHIGMNPEYCTKVFKKATGLTLKEYIVSEKMEAAKVLLKTTDLPITLISSHVGYGNYSNFTRSFKQLTGMTPMEYRNR